MTRFAVRGARLARLTTSRAHHSHLSASSSTTACRTYTGGMPGGLCGDVRIQTGIGCQSPGPESPKSNLPAICQTHSDTAGGTMATSGVEARVIRILAGEIYRRCDTIDQLALERAVPSARRPIPRKTTRGGGTVRVGWLLPGSRHFCLTLSSCAGVREGRGGVCRGGEGGAGADRGIPPSKDRGEARAPVDAHAHAHAHAHARCRQVEGASGACR